MTQPRLLETVAAEAYSYPLLIRRLLPKPETTSQEIVSDGRRFGYAAFIERVHRLASGLSQLGVQAGDTVAVMDWDSHRYLECYFAIPMLGAILQTVNVRLAPAAIGFTLRQSGASTLLYHNDFKPLADALLPALDILRVVTFGGMAGDGFEALIKAGDPGFAFDDFDENAIATTFHTTGTTGDPKQVFFSHRQLVLHTLAAATTIANQPVGQNVTRRDVYMPMTPMFHVHAWGMPFIATMLGMKQVYPGRYDPPTLLALKRNEGVTYSHCVPTILRMVVDAAKANAWDVGPWTMMIGGSALPEALAQEAEEVGIMALSGYGMSETGPVVTLARSQPEDTVGVRCRAGFPLPLVEVAIDQARGGELTLRAPWLTQGYSQQHASDALWDGGRLHTGDIAEIDADGAVRIVDRLKDVIKTGGEWVSSIELEALLTAEPGVAEAAVVGIPDARWGERPIAFVVRAAGPTVSEEALREAVVARALTGAISRYAVPDAIHFCDALPRTSVGKVDKKALKETAHPSALFAGA
ncbi:MULTISPECIES: long-chain-fatty-acid--CoA ligase [Sphingomonas]|jgi:fatty-acyl-CoA synthase|uniref:long-chain-fatty-acid--CoA ligase n=1 Tax=Sphingomonas TaxID=13687 RepID=UPI00254B960B|nr:MULTISPECIES: long-chain-fatty-acid--CoA ligase [Sphingomonas]MDK8216816.1 long-chain-fatty-acid--CoA ligase [Sphingomonas sp. UMB7805-LC452B]